MLEDRSSKLFFARVAEQAERYDEMLQVMTEIANMPGELSTEERNLLSVAFKNIIGARRSSWRVLSGIREVDADENSLIVKARQMLQLNVEKELEEICQNILNLLSTRLIPSAQLPESQVFYYKMKGDYERYLAEITTDDKRAKAAEDSLVAYKAATDIATDKLSSIDPVRLGLALNFSVFYYEILNNPERACELAENAFNLPPQDMDKLRDESHKDSALIMQLLRDNLTLWNSDVRNEDVKADTRPDGQ